MGSNPPTPPAPRPAFSPDGLWWWDGTQWKSAVSPDGLWRWDGQAWVPARPMPQPAAGGSGPTALLVTCLVIVGVLLLVGVITVAVLFTMSSQISNVFSNVAAALGATPSP